MKTVMKILVPLLAMLGPVPLVAQAWVAPAGSPEAQTMGTKSVAIAFTPTRGPARMPLGRVELGLGVLTVPQVSDDENTPITCFTGETLSNTNALVVAAQPRIRVGLGGGFAAEAGWVPPVSVSGALASPQISLVTG